MKTDKTEKKEVRKVKTALKLDDRIARGMNVQYLGEIPAFNGQKGEVIDIIGANASVMFNGANQPISLSQDSLTIIDDNQSDDRALATSNKPRYRFIANTSGGPLLIPDLNHPGEEKGGGLAMGEKVDLLMLFSPKEINRSAGLKNSVTKISETNGLPMITVLSSLEDELPKDTFVKPLSETLEPGTTIQAPENPFDEKIDLAYEKEEKQAEKARGAAYNRRSTRQHGRASEHKGK